MIFLVSYLRKGNGDLYKAATKKESEMLRGEREIKSSLLILDWKDGKLSDSGKQEEGTIFYKLHVLGMNYDLWNIHLAISNGSHIPIHQN